MKGAPKLVAEENQHDFFRIAYPSALLHPYITYYFEIRLKTDQPVFSIAGLPSVNNLIGFPLNNRRWHSVQLGTGKVVTPDEPLLFGHTSTLYAGHYSPGMHWFFIKLQPGIASWVFRENARHWENQQVPLQLLRPVSFSPDQLSALPDFDARIAYSESVLKHWLYKEPVPDAVMRVNQIMGNFLRQPCPQNKFIYEICAKHWTSYASARRYFREFTGFSPKFSQRLIRFKQALKTYQVRGYQFNWDEFGYTDFPHFSKECRGLTGLAPRSLI